MLAGALKYTAQFTGIISNFSFDQLFMAFILQRRIVFFFFIEYASIADDTLEHNIGTVSHHVFTMVHLYYTRVSACIS